MDDTSLASRRTILRATVVAALTAAAILVTIVLPAEYGIDPLGTGAALGLTALARSNDGGSGTAATLEAIRPGVNTPQPAVFKRDEYQVELRPFEGVEYKYRMEKGASMVYGWTATNKVQFEFHGEPDGAPPKYFESYEKSENSQAQGSFVAPTSGIHGWYWKNPGVGRITVKLITAGFYREAIEFHDGDRIIHPLTGPASGSR